MNINFTQGIINYPHLGSIQTFLQPVGGYVSFSAFNGSTDIAFAQGSSTYLVSEPVDVPNAWGPLDSTQTHWLYWDVNTTTAVITRGSTTIQPIASTSRPYEPTLGLHWFDTTNRLMYVFEGVRWRQVIRVFAASFLASTLTPLGSGFPSTPFAGTQVGILQPGTLAGRIIADNVGQPIRRSNGQFFTSEDDFFINGSPVNAVRLESGIVDATAGTNLAMFQVVKYVQFNTVSPAAYADIEDAVIGIMMEDVTIGGTGTLCIQGRVTNPAWNWTNVGVPLWVTTGGALTPNDPHVADPLGNTRARAAVARVISPTSIIFDQGLGGRGPQGLPGTASSNIATAANLGVVKLSTPAVDINNPVVVGDNDIRNSNARQPLAHTQAATTITTSPYGLLTGITAAVQLQQLEDNKLNLAGGQMSGPLALVGLSTVPTAPLGTNNTQLANTAYVISAIANQPAITVNWGDILGVPSTFPPSVHTHPLSQLTQSGATAGQVPQWNGSAWVATTPNTTTGFVVGPGSSVDNTIPRFDGTTGSIIKQSGVVVTDGNEISGYSANVKVEGGANYTLVPADSGKIIELVNGSPMTLTVPPTLERGFNCTVVQAGVGTVTVVTSGAGSVVNRQSHFKTAGLNAMCALYVRSNVGGNSAVVVFGGDTVA